MRLKKRIDVEKTATTLEKIVYSASKLQGKMDAMADGTTVENDFLPPWENIFDGDAKRNAQVRALSKLVNSGTIASACRAAGIGRGQFNEWMKEEEFKAAFDLATEEVADDLEEIAILRAKAGSDPLMSQLLKAYRPEKFSERRTVQHQGNPDRPIIHKFEIEGARARLANEIKKLAAGKQPIEVSAEVMDEPTT